MSFEFFSQCGVKIESTQNQSNAIARTKSHANTSDPPGDQAPQYHNNNDENNQARRTFTRSNSKEHLNQSHSSRLDSRSSEPRSRNEFMGHNDQGRVISEGWPKGEAHGHNARTGDRNQDARQSGPTDQESNSRKRFRPAPAGDEGDDDVMCMGGLTPSQKFSTPGVRRESSGLAEAGEYCLGAPSDSYETGIAAWKVCCLPFVYH